jgi:hypothetical protein
MRRGLTQAALMLGLAAVVAGIVIAMFPRDEPRVAVPVAISVASAPASGSTPLHLQLDARGTTTTASGVTRGGGTGAAAVNGDAGTVGFRIPRKKATRRAKRKAPAGALRSHPAP